MKTKLLWLIGSVGALSFASLQGCGDDEEPSDPTAGSGGSTSGKGGSTGKGGSKAAGGDTGAGGGDTGAGGGDTGAGGGDTGAGGGDTGAGGGDTGAGGGGAGDRDGACADYCTAYLDADACLDDTLNDYADQDDCVMTCVDSDWELTGATGNTIECREIHAGNAAAAANADMQATHCGHAAADSTDICN